MEPRSYPRNYVIPSDFGKNSPKDIELSFIIKFLQSSIGLYAKNLETIFQSKEEILEFEQVQSIISQTGVKPTDLSLVEKELILQILDLINRRLRLKHSNESLRIIEKNYVGQIIPTALPSQYVNHLPWFTGNEQNDKDNWIGHGFYWKMGEGKKDSYSFADYDCFEDKFHYLRSAQVVAADYQLIQRDFPFLASKSSEFINNWLLMNSAYYSEKQVQRISPGGDLHEFLNVGNDINKYIDFECKQPAIRQKGGGRAVQFIVDDTINFLEDFSNPNESFPNFYSINAKGAGVQGLWTDSTLKNNGMLSLVDAFKEFAIEKLLTSISEREKTSWSTIKSYAIIQTGIRYKEGVENHSTGFVGDQMALILRQGNSRFCSVFDEACYFSVVQDHQLRYGNGRNFEEILYKYHMTSEQNPMLYISQHKDVQQILESEDSVWNIQADSALSHFVDYSQFYAIHTAPLDPFWKLSKDAVRKGILLGRGAVYVLQNRPDLYEEIFGVKQKDEAVKKLNEELLELKKVKLFQRAGDVKPENSWSWFLQVDDSELSKWSFQVASESHTLFAEKQTILKFIQSKLNFTN